MTPYSATRAFTADQSMTDMNDSMYFLRAVA